MMEKMKEELLIMSNNLESELINFLENHPIERFSKNLRNLLLHYLQINMSDRMGVMPDEIKDLLFDLYVLFAILDKFEDKKNWIVVNTNWLVVPEEREIIRKYIDLMEQQLKINNEKDT